MDFLTFYYIMQKFSAYNFFFRKKDFIHVSRIPFYISFRFGRLQFVKNVKIIVS